MLSNAQLKQFTSLKQRKFRDRTGTFLVEGVRLCREALLTGRDVKALLYHRDSLAGATIDELLRLCNENTVLNYTIDRKSVDKLSDTVAPQGVFCVVRHKTWDLQEIVLAGASRMVALENVRDPGNVGTICRTAAWFGIDALLLGPNCVEITNPKVARASMGAIFHLPVVSDFELSSLPTEAYLRVFTTYLADVSGSVDYKDVKFFDKSILVLGGETEQIADSIRSQADQCIRIPRTGHGDSLNVAVAAGILMARLAS